MKETGPSDSIGPPMNKWQKICDILLPIHMEGTKILPAWLMENLGPLGLPEELMHRILKSTEVIMERAKPGETGFEQIHLFIILPVTYDLNGGSWGFFRIEKMESEGTPLSHNQAIEFYLYPEG